MREIKFRAWDKDAETMVLQSQSGGEYCWHIDVEEIWIENIIEDYTPKIELMQYTGLKDKKGVEIYEGDVVKAANYYKNPCEVSIGVIIYEKTFARYSLKTDDSWHSSSISESHDHVSKIKYEVIGNIHENPDLLDTKKSS